MGLYVPEYGPNLLGPGMLAYIYLCSLFTGSELLLLLSRRAKSEGRRNRRDKSSLLLLWITIPVCLTCGGFASAIEAGHIAYNLKTIAVIIVITGLLTRWAAIVQLGNLFTVDVAIAESHTLKTNGLYRIVRHPSYLGLLLIIIGFAVYFNNIFSLVIVIVPFALAMNYRIRVEEKALTEAFGEQYNNYKKDTARIIPWIY